jgi:adenosylcobinamide-phosphate synthase
MIFGSAIAAWLIIYLTSLIHPLLSNLFQIIMLASCLAGKSLRKAAEDVINTINPDDLTVSRQTLSMYVGRDTSQLSMEDILRALLETVTENATDGVTAPLFYAIVGGLIHPWLMVPFAWGYKASSTLDSMVGYRREPYTHLGWCSAKLEDILTWIPCRLTVFSVGILSGNPLRVWKLCFRDAVLDPSPNSGWSECVYAAALNVQVGGLNYYQGELREKPLLGDNLQPITVEIIDRALNFTRYTCLLWLGIITFIQLIVNS